ncbi:MAG: hypothetical protein KDE28_16310, partial [Anaerolineales bacterium]|nr:hypothetical protein [Anaerolineales bacterium]
AYDELELALLGLTEGRLRPAYFSTTTNSWTIPAGYTVDTDANRVIMQIDHFTDYVLLNTPLGYTIHLPLVIRQ